MLRGKTTEISEKPAGKAAKRALFLLCEVFCAFSFVRLLRKKLISCALMALLTMVLLCIPTLIEKYLSCRIALPVYLFLLVYAMGALLGDGYDLYHLTKWWDKAMHLSSGVIFAMFGVFLAGRLNGGAETSLLLRTAFALCLSIAASAVWEIFEYVADLLFHSDMQNDTYITEINSYFLGDTLGIIGHIESIESVTVNGVEMAGYIDIGLIDTMRDMIIETAGAVVYVAAYLFDRGRHPVFARREPYSGNAESAA